METSQGFTGMRAVVVQRSALPFLECLLHKSVPATAVLYIGDLQAGFPLCEECFLVIKE